MNNPIKNVVGIKKEKFDNFFAENGFTLNPARLIPVHKLGDELALTSVFLSALRLIKEFKEKFFDKMKLPKSGKLFVYTEVEFPQFKDSRVDGLIVIVKGGEIKNAAILEMKNGTNTLEQPQIEKYMKIAKELNIPKIITISNQFVSEPSQSPLKIKVPKNVELFHFSWTYILTLARILLFKNDNNIEDKDQIEIMKEVVAYFENKNSNVHEFTQMKKGWGDLVKRINSGEHLKKSDDCVIDTVSSWQQEEKNMALILSKELGVLVKLKNFKGTLKARIDTDSKQLIENKMLFSTFVVKYSASNIIVKALFEKRIIEMSVKLDAPSDKGLKGQIGWLKSQIEKYNKKNPEKFSEISKDLKIDLKIKNIGIERISYEKIDEIYKEIKNREIKEFGIVQVKDFGKDFSDRKKFIKIIEKMFVEFYAKIVQHLELWKKPSPKIPEEKNVSENNQTNISDNNNSGIDSQYM